MAVNPNKSKKALPVGRRVLVALSGGVDSAVSAALLKEQGYDVSAAHMVCYNDGPYCTSDKDRADATKVAGHLNIPFQVFDFRKEYKEKVIKYFYEEYIRGSTPNPDVACNREIKFGIFLNKALEMGYDYIATGHYSRVEFDQSLEQFRLFAGADLSKDQSYFLYNLTKEQLSHILFPIGHLKKTEVREIAARLKLPNATKKDSQGICFIGEANVRELISQKIKSKYGDIINPTGRVIGKHHGLAFYTIGQREGVGISQKIPHYVVSKDKQANTLTAAPFNDQSHYKGGLSAEKVNWVGSKPEVGESVQVRIRYRQPLTEAKINKLSADVVEIVFAQPQKAVTSGQSVVLYQRDEVLGGGTII